MSEVHDCVPPAGLPTPADGMSTAELLPPSPLPPNSLGRNSAATATRRPTIPPPAFIGNPRPPPPPPMRPPKPPPPPPRRSSMFELLVERILVTSSSRRSGAPRRRSLTRWQKSRHGRRRTGTPNDDVDVGEREATAANQGAVLLDLYDDALGQVF